MKTRDIYSVGLSDAADADLEAIIDYVAQHRSPADALRLLDRLEAKFGTLANFPRRGSVPPELDAIGERGYRQMLLAPYRLIYATAERAVTIVLIADGRRDMGPLLQRRLLGG